MNEVVLGRRKLLGGMLGLGAAAVISAPAGATLAERRIAFRNVHNNEKIDARYYGADGWDFDGLAEINHGLRDWRTGEIARIDRPLLDTLADIRDRLGVSARRPFDLISGYRSPNTNAALRESGGERTGVARHSQHTLAKATDIALPGVPLDRLRAAAMVNQRGGVGFYPRDGFVHVDTGRVRSW